MLTARTSISNPTRRTAPGTSAKSSSPRTAAAARNRSITTTRAASITAPLKDYVTLMRVAGVTSRITDTARKVRTTLKIGTARPRRQPSAQLSALPDRDHPGPRPRACPRVSRAQTSRRQEPPRSPPLPQTTPRPRRLPDSESEPGLDIGATHAQISDRSPEVCRESAETPRAAQAQRRSHRRVSPGSRRSTGA